MSYSENLQGPLVAGYIYNVGRLPAIWLSEEIIRNQEYLEAISDGGDDIKFTDTLFKEASYMTSKSNEVNIPGPKAREYIERDSKVISPSYTRVYPFVMDHGEGSEVWDVDGNRYVDFAAGIAVTSTGHSHPKVTKAIKDQAAKFLHISGTDFYYPQQIELAEKLAEIVPMSGAKGVFFTNSGAESVEAALKLSLHQTGRSSFIAFYGAFHGRTMGALSFTASKPVQREGFSPFMPEVTHVPFSNPFRCPHHREEEDCRKHCICVDYIEETVLGKKVSPSTVAAVIVEPVQGEGGYIFPQDNFLPRLRELCDKHSILLIADEIQTGIGRTGKWFGIEHWGVEPDIVCSAKGLASGMPLGAMIARSEVMKWGPGSHASTFGGNPLSCVAALATLELIEGGFMENASRMGEVFIEELTKIQKRHPSIVRVEGRGLMVVVELAKDQTTKEPATELRDDVVNRAFTMGVLLLGCGTSGIRFVPPLNIPKELVEEGLTIFEKALSEAEEASGL
jgi:4-aminobutyrate aminotransferase